MAPARPEPTGVLIRPAVRADLPALAELWFAFETWLNALEAEPQPVDRAKFEGFEAMAFGHTPACSVLLAELDGRTVGYLVHYPGVWMDDMAPCLHIADLFVHPDAHRHGIGRALMNRAAEIARAAGAPRLFWTVWRDNPVAQSFYKSLGAEVLAEEILMKWSSH
jgi:GNAT superfamily N-acetyltransferase